jgi:hypothetical protein
MQIIDNGSVPLCNAEVLAHLNSIGIKAEADGCIEINPKRLRMICRNVRPPPNRRRTSSHVGGQTTTYLRIQTQPTSPERDGQFTPAAITSLTATLRGAPWNLLEAEVLQILNHGPTDADEVGMLLEDAYLRFSEEQLGAIAAMVVDKLKVRTQAEVEAMGPTRVVEGASAET